MPIDIASYRRWEGRARATPLAVFAIAGTMIRRRMRVRFVRLILFAFILVPSLFAAAAFYFARLGSGPFAQRQLEAFGLKDVNLLSLSNHAFDRAVGLWAALLAALVGAPLIAEDRRAHALPLYFSRPINHIEYVVGKMASTAYFLAYLLILPRICMYGIEIAFSEAEGVALRQLPTLLSSCATGALGVAVFTSIALGVSSLTERPTYAAFFLLGVTMLSFGLSHFLAHALRDSDWLALSPYASVRRIGLDLLPMSISRLRFDPVPLEDIGLRWAWIGVAGWTAVPLGVLVARVRRVEVVT